MKRSRVLDLAAFPAIAAAASCGCYTSNSTALKSTQTYTNYAFIDFRSLPANGADLTVEPDVVKSNQDDGSGDLTSSYFSSPDFTKIWAIQNYTQPPSQDPSASTVRLVNSPQNIYASQDSGSSTTQLTLRTARLDQFSSCGELNSAFTMHGASYRARARVRGDKGAVAGIFFYKNDTDESDIEMLTNDPSSTFRASNQPDVGPDGNDVPNASTKETPSGYLYTDWVDYRLDWTAAQTAWYVDGALVDTKTYGVPSDQVMVMLNMWSNGGSWSGNMTVGDRAYLDVQWVEILYNTTDADTATCAAPCDVDSETQVGQFAQSSQTQASQTSSPSAAASQTNQPSKGNIAHLPSALLLFAVSGWSFAFFGLNY